MQGTLDHPSPARPPAITGDTRERTALALVRAALEHARRPVLTTNFRPGAVALLHLVQRVRRGIPVIWVDTGYNTTTTYRYAAALEARLGLALKTCMPRVSPARWVALHGPPPRPGEATFERFVEDFKLEPFRRAFDELHPDLWLTGIRRGQTAYRDTLGIRSRGYGGVTRLAPLFEWTDADVAGYLARHALPDNHDYVDPTKPGSTLECGLQQQQ
ncbi:MAG: phosphoadenosine phosphosulfate reductase family protein [Gammaproteobacteria bacterium]|nr:phosphoadenosine phosphosulfate reductase family protein [Gammaproteobacteria bacterium]